MLSKSSSGNFGLAQISWMFVATLLLVSALALASPVSEHDAENPEDWDKRLYRGLGKRSANYGGDDFQTMKRLKMPLVYKRLKFFGAQNSQPTFGRRDFDEDAGEYFE